MILLLGPTASGKSAAAMALAADRPIEIISVDSALVYRGMDIGTAKPTQADRAAVPHHLIDIIEPTESYSAARFAADARRLIDEIRARGRQPLLVGGTLLYAKALIEGLHDLPLADPAVRARLEEQASRVGWPAMHARLAERDPVTAARLEPGDAQRVQRALEVIEISGRPMSALLAEPSRASPPGLRFEVIALEPSERSQLHARIATRLAQMFAGGFLDEVRRLRARGDLRADLPSMRCVGYRQAWEHLDGLCDAQTMHERALAATRQLAKRQLTWLRAMPHRHVIDCLLPDAPSRVKALIEELR
ncbi:MAG TPA: tRNA (adenosine(37)-N6)-dimethylallyltransferase MiaA [Burkholderiaceae bacterium]|nr:tRNA (adenosine(37)-N6)-dimethylallyltransferase MiaA [Burkholderiaceae bacterium]